MRRWILLTMFAAVGCAPRGDHGHDHDHDHDHGGDAGHHGDSDEAEASIAVTAWAGGYELFLEVDAPVAKTALGYAGHVTRIDDNRPATRGTLTLRFEQDGFAVESHTDAAPARPGVYAGSAVAPAAPGDYRLVVAWADGAERAEWDGGVVTVGADAAVPREAERSGEITFLKEAQWQVPFRVGVVAARPLAPVVRATATAKPAPGAASVVAAPTAGLLVWTDRLPVVGRRVKRGERLATLLPAGAAEHWTRLQADVATARIDRDLAARELERIEGLAARELLPARRVAEARAAVERADAEVRSTEARAAALSSGSSRAVSIVAPAGGFIVAVGGEHGRPVEAGAPLVTVSSADSVLLDGHVHERGREQLSPVVSLMAERGDWEAAKDLSAHGARVLTERLVFSLETLSAPVAVLVDGTAGILPGDLVDLRIAVGEPEPQLAVPVSAVVEIATQPFVFVQRTGESFTRRRVELGRSDGAWVAVRSGVEEGERVVVRGGFDVHVAALSGSLESHRH